MRQDIARGDTSHYMSNINNQDISKIVKQSGLFKESIVDESHGIPIQGLLELAEKLFACKSEFISKIDTTTFLYVILSNHLNDKMKSGVTLDQVIGQAQTLAEIFSNEEMGSIELEITKYFESLPRKYSVHFHLPSVFFSEPLEMKIGKQICLKFDNLRQPKPTGLFGSTLLADLIEKKTGSAEKKEYSLSVYIDHVGYLSYKNFEKPFSIFKQLIYLGICHSLFSLNKNYVDTSNFRRQGGLFSDLASALDPLSDYFIDKNNENKTPLTLEKNETDFINGIELNPEISQAEIKSKINLLCKSFSLLLDDSNKKDKNKILAGLEWAFNSEINENETFKFILKCIAIEAVVGDSDSEKSTLKLSNRCAYQLARNHQERKDFLIKFPELYKLRSHLVHGNKVSLAPDEKEQLYFADSLLRRIFLSELQMLHQ